MIAFFYSLRSALRSLWAYRLRTALTALGVMMGVATVIAILAIIEGLNSSFRDQVASLGTGTLYVSQRPWIQLGDWWRYWGRPSITQKEAEYIDERFERAKAVVPFVDERASVLVGRTTLHGVRIIGSTADWAEMSGISPTEGRFLVEGDVGTAREVAIAGFDVVNALRREGMDLEDRIFVNGHPLRVVGLMPSRGQIFGKSQDDFVVLPLSLFERYFGNRRSIGIGVVVEPEELDQAADELESMIRVRRGLKPWEESNFSVNQQAMFVELYRELTRSLFATAIGLGIITLIVGGVGIMNIMLVAVAERTREIGIRKALGARPRAILLQFVVEAGMVSGTGGAIGTVFGILLAKGIAEVTPLQAQAAPSQIVIGLIFGIFVGVTFGFLPAYRASRLVPVRALSTGE